MDSLVKLSLNLDVAKSEICKRAQGLQAFSQRFIGDAPKPDTALSDTRARQGDSTLLAICGLHDRRRHLVLAMGSQRKARRIRSSNAGGEGGFMEGKAY